MKATKSPMVIAPLATRAPPRPSTIRKAAWIVVDVSGVIIAWSLAMRRPAA